MPQSALDKSPQRIRRMFDAIAPWYDFLNHFFSLGIDIYWRRKAVACVLNEKTPGGPVLDVCCGTGDLSQALYHRSKKLDAEREIFGVDFSENMVEIARRKTAGLPSALSFSVADALELPFSEQRFAAVTTAFGLRNVGDTQRGLSEMVRVCQCGGTVAVLEFSMPTLPGLALLYRFYFRAILPWVGQCLAPNRDQAYCYLPESVQNFDTPDQLRQRMETLGLTHVQSKSMTFGIAVLTWGQKTSE